MLARWRRGRGHASHFRARGAVDARSRDRRSRAHARSGAATAGSRACTPIDLLGARAARGGRARRDRPDRGRPGRRRLRRPGRDAGDRTSPATRGSPPGSRSRPRPPLSTRSAGRRSRRRTSRPRSSPRAWSTPRVACGVELMSRVPMGSTVPKDPYVGKPINKQLLGALRVHVAVRGRRAHRREVGHHPRRPRRVRQAVAGPRRARRGRRAASSAPDRRRSMRRTSGDDGEAERHHAHGRARDEGLRDTTLEGLAKLKPRARPRSRVPHRRDRRRRSATAPARCCS